MHSCRVPCSLRQSQPHKQASLFRIPQASNEGRHKFRSGGQFGSDSLLQLLFALAAHLFAEGDFFPHRFGKLDDVQTAP